MTDSASDAELRDDAKRAGASRDRSLVLRAADRLASLSRECADWKQAAGVEASLRREFLERAVKAEASLSRQEGWRPIESAPKDGTPIDLWIIGNPSSIEFLTTISSIAPDRKSRQGRITDWQWVNGDWRIKAGLAPFMGLRMHDCVATHWQPLPTPPEASS